MTARKPTRQRAAFTLVETSVTALRQGHVIAWNGPYLNAEIGPLAADSIQTGYRAYVKNLVTRYDATTNAAEFYIAGVGTGGTYSANNTQFAAVTVVGLSTK